MVGTGDRKVHSLALILVLATLFSIALAFSIGALPRPLHASELPWCNAKIVYKKFPPPPFYRQNIDTRQNPTLQNVIDMLMARAYYRPSEKVIYISHYLKQPRLKNMRLFILAHECAHHEQFNTDNVTGTKLASCLNKADCLLGFTSLHTRRFLLEADASCRAAIKLVQHMQFSVLDYMKQHYSQVQSWHRQNRFIGKYMIMGTRNVAMIKTLDYCSRPGASAEKHLKLWVKK